MRTALVELAVHNTPGNNVLYAAIVNSPPGTTTNVLSAIFWTANQGTSWTAMDLPQTMEGGSPQGIHVGGQGNKHLSLAADPANANLVYIGGDRQPGNFPNSIGATGPTGRLFRGNRSVAANGSVPSPQWSHLTHSNTASKSSPHADSRHITFDANQQLIEANDGGIYRRTSPALNSGDWFSLSGTLQITEVYSVAYDPNSHTVFGGAQDNGTARQDSADNTSRTMLGGDGGDVAVDPFTLAGSGQSIRYSSIQNLGRLKRSLYDANNGLVSEADLFTKNGSGQDVFPPGFTPQFVTPIEVNAVQPTQAQLGAGQSTRLAIGSNTIYESSNSGTAAAAAIVWTQVPTAAGFPGVNRAAMAYGGHRNGAGITAATKTSPIVITSNAHGLSNGDQVEISEVLGNTAANGSFVVTVLDANRFSLNGSAGNANYISGGFWRSSNPDVLYVGSSNQVWVRTTSGGTLSAGGALQDKSGQAATDIRDVVVDPDEWTIAYAVDSSGHVYQTLDNGATWNDTTGNLLGLLESATNQQSGVDANLWAVEVVRDVVIPGEVRTPNNLLVVGGAYGVFYQTLDVDPSGEPVWKRLGAELPNAVVFDLDQGVDVDGNAMLVASTLGRGTWSINLSQALTVPRVADLLGPTGLDVTITGVTVVTHGLEPFDVEGDSMLPLARAIRQKIDDTNGTAQAWLLDYDSQSGLFDPVDSLLPLRTDLGTAGELVLMFDWSEGSQHMSPGWMEAAGDALFGMLTRLNLVQPSAGTGSSLHFIGHGAGAVVTSEAVERLAYFGVPVDQVTYLDPHDFDQGMVFDSAQQPAGHGQPAGYGAAVWDNVAFADVYYQTRARNGASVSDQLVPRGRPIPGAFNFLLADTNHLPTSDYDALNVFGDDRYVWEGFYLSTVNGQTPTANEASQLTEDTPAPATPIPVDALGYAFSRVKSTAVRPEATFYVHPDRGPWQTGTLYRESERVQFGGLDYVALRTHTSRDSGVSEPAANQPPDAAFWQLAAGPFAAQDHQDSPAYLVDPARGTPNHAGLLEHRLTADAVAQARQRPRWNPLPIVNGNFDQVGDLIGFDSRRVPGWTDFASAPQFDPVDFPIDVVQKVVTLNGQQPGITHNWVYVPAEAERLSIDLKVTRFSGNDRLQVLLGDTVLVEESPTDDDLDITFIDADFQTHRYVIPPSLQNQVHDLTVRLVDGGDGKFNAEVQVDNLRMEGYLFEVLAGDVTLIDLGAIIGGSAFALQPPSVLDAGKAIEAKTLDTAEDPFINTGRFYFVPDFVTDGATLTFDDDDATPGNDDLATIRFQVNLVDVGLVDKIAKVRVLDGYSSSGDNSIILTGSVGASGVNKTLEVYHVQQRLRYFNVRGKDGAEVVADGLNGPITQEAIRIFQAETQEDGKGDPAVTSFFVDGRVDVGYRTIRWLNSPVAPFWVESRPAVRIASTLKMSRLPPVGRCEPSNAQSLRGPSCCGSAARKSLASTTCQSIPTTAPQSIRRR